MTTPPQEPRARELQKAMNQAVILELLERAQHSEGNLENMIDSPQFARKIRCGAVVGRFSLADKRTDGKVWCLACAQTVAEPQRPCGLRG
jgi:hypothetical protein